jgi:hypothetical protein
MWRELDLNHPRHLLPLSTSTKERRAPSYVTLTGQSHWHRLQLPGSIHWEKRRALKAESGTTSVVGSVQTEYENGILTALGVLTFLYSTEGTRFVFGGQLDVATWAVNAPAATGSSLEGSLRDKLDLMSRWFSHHGEIWTRATGLELRIRVIFTRSRELRVPSRIDEATRMANITSYRWYSHCIIVNELGGGIKSEYLTSIMCTCSFSLGK